MRPTQAFIPEGHYLWDPTCIPKNKEMPQSIELSTDKHGITVAGHQRYISVGAKQHLATLREQPQNASWLRKWDGMD